MVDATVPGRVAPGWAGRAGGVGPLRPVRSAQHCDSGERVTEPARPAHLGARTRPPRAFELRRN